MKKFTTKVPYHQQGSYYETGDGYFAFPNRKDKPLVNLSVIVPAYNEEERCKCHEFLCTSFETEIRLLC